MDESQLPDNSSLTYRWTDPSRGYSAFHPIGDINNDGYGDILLGYQSETGMYFGHSTVPNIRPRVVLGNGETWTGELTVDAVVDDDDRHDLYGDLKVNGEVLQSIQLVDSEIPEPQVSTLGGRAGAIGNFNGDEYDDFVLGDDRDESFADPYGRIYVLYGGPTENWQQNLELRHINQ